MEKNNAEDQFVGELFAPLQNYMLFAYSLKLNFDNRPNPSTTQSELLFEMIKSGRENLYKNVVYLMPENTPPELFESIKKVTDKFDVNDNLMLTAALILIMGNITGSLLIAADNYLRYTGKKSIILEELKGKNNKLRFDNKILDPKEKQEDTIFNRYKLLFKKLRRRPTDEELAVPTEIADLKVKGKMKNSLVVKIGRIRREPTFIYKQVTWLDRLQNNKKIKDSLLKEAANKEIKRLQKLYEKTTNKEIQRSERSIDYTFDENRYHGKYQNIIENEGNSYLTPEKKTK